MLDKYSFYPDTIEAGSSAKIFISFKEPVEINLKKDILDVLIINGIESDSSQANWTIEYTSFFPGSLEYDSLAIAYKTISTGVRDTVYLSGEGPVIKSQYFDTTYQSGYLGFIPIEFPKMRVFGLLALVLAAVLILFFGVKKLIKLRKPKKDESHEIVKMDIPVYEKYRKLVELRLWENDETKQHFYLLCEIVKQHLSIEFNISLMEMTTAEILFALKSIMEYKDFSVVKDFFGETDIYKYTDTFPEGSTVVENNSAALGIIENIKKPVAQEEKS